ncbi:membrane protein [Actinoplanes sp. SE50]|uniref:DoxX family protein n=1 Tax=unclassified Actinoplanes TaxID=2626549 RepID=UPI00023EC996|nr:MULTISPECIES: DoxX family protein [unclassified Actinoplanes]AEV84776.1 DoxX family protein [Actinoplanes sp. SE50/110]ATO83168.1 membrane protein [Actinoplanes sp. SE50]SLM00575.1 membrane protein [Actinoplanes sp. SE50/110]
MRGNPFSEAVWALFRGVIGLLFALHGVSTVFGVFGGNRGSGHAAAVGSWPGWYAGVIQLVCGLLVLVGLLTVPAAILASGSMAYAYFTVHQPHGLLPLENGGDAPALFCWAFLAIAVVGAGRWSLDALRRSRTPSLETVDA